MSKEKKKTGSKIRITLIKSPIGRKPSQVATVKSLGLGKLNSTVEQVTNDAILGMVKSIDHLVKVEEI